MAGTRGGDADVATGTSAGGSPITPEQAAGGRIVPALVIDVFNQLVAKHFNEKIGAAVVKQEDVVALLVEAGCRRDTIFAQHWLDVEPIYERAGWKVRHDKPGYCEDYAATFTFTVKR